MEASAAGLPVGIDGVFNVRSFGGHPSNLKANCVTRHGVLYRSGHLKDITPRGKQQINDLRISSVIDLTNSEETKALFSETDNALSGCKVHNFSLAKHAYSAEQLSKKYKRYLEVGEKAIAEGYVKLLAEGYEVIRDILLLIRDSPNDVFLIHCAMGKDRTGVLFAVLLALAGVSNESIAEDYSRSEASLEASLPQIAVAIKKAIPTITEKDSLERAKIVIQTKYVYQVSSLTDGSRREAMLLTLQMVEEEFGGMMGYLDKLCGIGTEDVKRIQDVLTSESSI